MTTKVLKRIVSVVLAMSIVLSFALVSVSATDVVPDIAKTDYVAGSDGNLIDTIPGGVEINCGELPVSVSGNIATLTANGLIGSSSDWGMNGFHINKSFISTLPEGSISEGPVLTQGTKVLFSVKVRKAADATADAKINLAYSSWYSVQYDGGSPIYTDNYPNVGDGFLVDSTEWTEFKAVMTAPKDCGGNEWSMAFGFSNGTAQGAKVEVDMSTMYLGLESAHDIDVTAVSSTVSAGSSTTVKATILNQFDDKFSGAQGGFSWYALSDDRESFAEGIEVTDNGDGTATVAVADTVAAGKYDIVAVSDTYANFAKGTEIKVTNLNNVVDYTPAADGNLIDTIPAGVEINCGELPVSVSDNIATLTATGLIGSSSDWGMNGFHINKSFISTLPEGALSEGPVLTQGTKVLFSVKVRKAADATQNAKINLAYSSWYNVQYESGSPIYTDNYPNVGDGFLVDSTEWTEFKAVMTAPKDCGGNEWSMAFGFSSGTAQGAKVEVDLSTMYLGTESAHDIEVTATSTKLSAGESTMVSATIVNQIDSAYSGAQGGFVWKAMDADRTATASGITVVPVENGTARVTVADTVAAGKYDIIAISDTYDGFARGVEITVINLKNDYSPAADGNLITTYPTEVAPNINDPAVKVLGSGNIASLEAIQDCNGSSSWGLQGIEVDELFVPTLQNGFGPEFTQGTKVLFRAKVRKAADATEDVKINVAYSTWYGVQYDGKDPYYADAYAGATAGFDVVSTDWVDFATVITVPANCGGQTWGVIFGFASGTKTGAKIEIDMESMYLGTEGVHDIEVTAAPAKVAAGESTVVTATIVNQVDLAYSGTQGGFSWTAMNADRSATVSGITVTDNADGTATVSVADSVADGTYYIVAASDTYEGFIKGVQITVGPKFEGITLNADNGAVTVATDTALNNAHLVFVTYDANGKMVDYEVKYVTLSAQESDEYAPSDLTAGSYTKAMLWSDMVDCTPLADMIQY